jgi:hypothetical protein
MKWLFRASSLIIASAVLAVGALGLVLWPRSLENEALPVPSGDQEVVWLYAATSPGPWERFIKALDTVVDAHALPSGDLGISLDKRSAFPGETTTIPEVVLSAQGTKGRLRFRWYKLTSDLKTQDWVKTLLDRRPAPLAIIGGSSSDLGIELAESLRQETKERGRLPPRAGYTGCRTLWKQLPPAGNRGLIALCRYSRSVGAGRFLRER